MGELACTVSEQFYLGKRMPGLRFAKSSNTQYLADSIEYN
jgi:hypothetical protein